ncbi:NADH-quinone oxidoreductase subunit A [Acidianus manzaensis]|uniref:NADH-quinone oxidoreductase subunit A n=1 Tax=Acidianus manzaensis TaxID=282676 RepID=A0A1W6K407_9CREN|nr:NADH-quinone oxidoreductase subunit A [Acidianus manzaensis]ARM77154.1 NADH-quinone oxidoreductase subunit A [Acidianus manzaensis]
MSLVQPLVAIGLPAILVLIVGYGGYKLLSLIVPHDPTPLKVSRFEAGNIPSGEGRLWFPLQYYGYLLIYVTIEPILVLLFTIASAPILHNFILFRNLAFILFSFIILVYPVIYYAISQINVLLNWELRR